MKILCTIEASLYRPEVRRWRDRMGHIKPQGEVVIVLPCSMRKPYSQSKSHRIFMRATKNFQELILTSPFGICPRELEQTYPIQSYDVSTIGDWSQKEIDVTGKCLTEYVDGKQVIAHVAGGYRRVCEEYLDDAVYTCKDGRVTSHESMENLGNELKKYEKIRDKNRNLKKLRSIACYQFNTEDASALIPDGSRVMGRFSKRIIQDGEQIATFHYETGLYSLNLKGGFIVKESINKNSVEIDFDLKTNTIFAPGVVNADSDIIPRDEVVILKNDEVVAVGKAVLPGEEMKNAIKGVAVRIRHRLK
jgi:archaeosine synthase